jgi:hypothetical protein
LSASNNQVLILSLFPSLSWWASVIRLDTPLTLFTGVISQGPLPYNRYRIATANGVQQLSVPLKGGRKQKTPLKDLQIDYTHDWQRQHWGALYSAYGRAPFYEHYAPVLEALIYRGYEKLEELNRAAIAWLSGEMRITVGFEESTNVTESSHEMDGSLPAYHQVFEDRLGFQPGLSVIDLLMNEGPYAARYLRG